MTRRERLEAILADVLNPLLAHDGGSIELAALDDGVLTLRLTGELVGCPGTTYVKRGVIEPAVREVAGPDLEIVYERESPL